MAAGRWDVQFGAAAAAVAVAFGGEEVRNPFRPPPPERPLTEEEAAAENALAWEVMRRHMRHLAGVE